MEAERYQITQDGKEYILSTNIINDKIIIECQDNNYQSQPIYSRDYSLKDLTSFSEIFKLTSTIKEVQDELNKAIENQQVRIINEGEYMEVVFDVQIDRFAQELTFQLPIKNQPEYSEESILRETSTQKNETLTEEKPSNVSYSKKTPKQSKEKPQTSQPPLPTEYSITDHDRINKIEKNTALLRQGHDDLIQKINSLKMQIQIIKKLTNDIRNENGSLNQKTLDLKKHYNNLIEAESALREENDDLRKEKHELLLKKSELEYYMTDKENPSTVKEVKVPIDGKKRRPTNVSKREKRFGEGYSSMTYSNTSPNMGYSSYEFGNNQNYK